MYVKIDFIFVVATEELNNNNVDKLILIVNKARKSKTYYDDWECAKEEN